MSLIEKAGLLALHRLDPEKAHDLSIRALAAGLAPLPGAAFTSRHLETEIAGLRLPNPVGLAAGYAALVVLVGVVRTRRHAVTQLESEEVLLVTDRT